MIFCPHLELCFSFEVNSSGSKLYCSATHCSASAAAILRDARIHLHREMRKNTLSPATVVSKAMLGLHGEDACSMTHIALYFAITSQDLPGFLNNDQIAYTLATNEILNVRLRYYQTRTSSSMRKATTLAALLSKAASTTAIQVTICFVLIYPKGNPDFLTSCELDESSFTTFTTTFTLKKNVRCDSPLWVNLKNGKVWMGSKIESYFPKRHILHILAGFVVRFR